MKLRRLFFDIETSPNIVLSWRLGYKINIDHSNLLQERAIICVGYKWQGEKEARVIAWDKKQSDRALLAEFSSILQKADECVGHNIDQFDLPWVKTRCVFHGLPPLPNIKTADTLQWARRRMLFNSNRLDYIASFLGIGSKLKTEFNLWKSILLENDRAALATMKRYCAQDVVLLEKVWEKLSKVVPAKTHAGVMEGRDKWSCPHCASENVHKVRAYVTAKGVEQQQMKCSDCGSYHNISVAARKDYENAKKRVA